MKKRALKLIVVCLFLFCLCSFFGCVQSNLTVRLNGNGGEITYSYKINKAIADNFFDGEPPPLSVEKINGELYYVSEKSFAASSNAELENFLTDLPLFENEGIPVFAEAEIKPYYIRLVNNSDIFSEHMLELAESSGVDLYGLISVDITVTMPSKINEHSKGNLSEDGQSVFYSFDLHEKSTLEISAVNVPAIVTLCAIIVAASALTVFAAILIKRWLELRADAEARRMPETPIDDVKE